jgi:hypothetical protein
MAANGDMKTGVGCGRWKTNDRLMEDGSPGPMIEGGRIGADYGLRTTTSGRRNPEEALLNSAVRSPISVSLHPLYEIRLRMDSYRGIDVNGAAYKSKGHATGVIVTEPIIIEIFLLIAFAVLAGEAGPFFADGVVETVTVVAAKNVSFHVVAAFNGHVTNGRSPLHDFPPALAIG